MCRAARFTLFCRAADDPKPLPTSALPTSASVCAKRPSSRPARRDGVFGTHNGLAAYVFTNDLTIAWKMAEGIEAGIVGINDPVPATPQCPFGGMKETGLGRELAHEGPEAYLETKYISFKLRE